MIVFDILGIITFYVASACGMILIIAFCALVTAIVLLAMWMYWCRYYGSYREMVRAY